MCFDKAVVHCKENSIYLRRKYKMATHCEEAGTNIRDEIQLVLTDVEMPEMDGYVLTQKIKADPWPRDLPVIMRSSLTAEANQSMGKMSVQTPICLNSNLRD
jgi:CheY-like chemotaxis protein